MLNIHDNCEKLTLGSFDKIELAAGVYAKVVHSFTVNIY